MSTSHKLPVYERIKADIRHRIESGEYKSGAQVPTEMALANTYAVSRGQSRQALRELALEGYLVRTRGKGSFVSPFSPALQTSFHATVHRDHGLAPLPPTRYNQELVQGFLENATELGLHTTFYYLQMSLDAEFEFLRSIRLRNLDGLAFWPSFRSREEAAIVAELSHSGLPCVVMDRYLPLAALDFVGTDNRQAYRQLTQMLLAKGHQRFAYVARDFNDSVMEDRFAGHMEALNTVKLPFHGAALDGDGQNVTREDQWACLARLLNPKDLPSAVFCTDDHTAFLVHDYLTALGARIPEDIIIATTIDDYPDESCEGRAFLTMRQDGYAIGAKAARCLMARIKDQNHPTEQHLLPAKAFEFIA